MDTITEQAEPTRASACRHVISDWDAPRYACIGCQQRTAQWLRDLPGLYAALSVTPARAGSPLVGSRHRVSRSTVPVSLAVVDLTALAGDTSVLMLLDTWAQDWADRSGTELPARWGGDGESPATHLCRWLRHWLDWACRQHPAIDDFVREIGKCYRRVRAEATGERPPRVVPRACPCGGSVPFRLGQDRFWCDACDTEYGWAEATRLPEARRRLAA